MLVQTVQTRDAAGLLPCCMLIQLTNLSFIINVSLLVFVQFVLDFG